MEKPTLVCAKCHAELSSTATEGLCPRCLIERALTSDEAADPQMTCAEPDSSIPRTPFTGTRLRYFGDYEVLEEIARGGMGVVFKARQVNLNRIVALKLINSGALASQVMVKRFKAEAEAAAVLNHPNIVPIHEIGEVHGQHYFSMGFIDGQNLRQRLAHQNLSPREAVALMIDLAHAVHHAHQHGVLHRDIKLENIVIDKLGRPHLADFGLAKIADHDIALTHTHAILGTPSYMAPEQARGETKHVTTAVDVYGLGAVLYGCLTGHPPFAGATSIETVRRVLEHEASPPSKLNVTVDRDLDTICLKCLEKEPAKRYASAESIADDLERWMRGEPIQARRVSGGERVLKWIKRRPALAAVVGASLVALLACIGVAISVPAYHKAERARRGEIASRQSEERQRKAVQEALTALQEADYIKNLSLAARELDGHDVFKADQFLEECATNLRGWEWRYLKRLCYSRHMLQTNDSRIVATGAEGYNARFDATGRQLLYQTSLGVTLVDISTRQPEFFFITRWTMPRGRMAFDSQRGRIALSHLPDPDREETAPTVLATLHGEGRITIEDRFVYDLAFSPDGKYVATANSSRLQTRVALWDSATGELVQTLSPNERTERQRLTAICFSADGKYLAAAQELPEVKPSIRVYVWRLSDSELIHRIHSDQSPIWRIAFTSDGTRLVGGGGRLDGGGEIRAWDLRSNTALFYHNEKKNCVLALAISPDGRRIASGGGIQDRREREDISISNLENGKELFTLKGHTAAIYDLGFSPTGNSLGSASKDGTIRIWDAELLAPIPRQRMIDLAAHTNASLLQNWHYLPHEHGAEDLHILANTEQLFDGIRFKIQGVIQLKSSITTLRFPEMAKGIKINATFERIHFLHATGWIARDGTEIGRYIFHYQNGEKVEVPIVYGVDLREWHNRSDATSTIGHGQVVERADFPSGYRLFHSTWWNRLPDVPVETMDFVSTMTDCFPFLVAVTVE